MITRDQALALLYEHTKSESLRRHCLGVETCVRWYAVATDHHPDEWGLAGLLHDFDYEAHPDEHPQWGMRLLETMDVPAEVIHAIGAHARYTGIPFETDLDKTLFACDELSGFITAVTYVRPSKSIFEVEVKSVLKKLKTPAFAAGVNREEVHQGAELLGLSLEEHIHNLLEAMRGNADELGLRGGE